MAPVISWLREKSFDPRAEKDTRDRSLENVVTRDVSRPASNRRVPHRRRPIHENKKSSPHFLQSTLPYRISPVPHGRDAHAVRLRRRAAASQQHTDDWFGPLADAGGIERRHRVASTTRRTDQVGQVPGGPTTWST